MKRFHATTSIIGKVSVTCSVFFSEFVPIPVAAQNISNNDVTVIVTDVPDTIAIYIVRIYFGENVETLNDAMEEVFLTRNDSFMNEFSNLHPGQYIITVQAQAGQHTSDIFTLPEFTIGMEIALFSMTCVSS